MFVVACADLAVSSLDPAHDSFLSPSAILTHFDDDMIFRVQGPLYCFHFDFRYVTLV